MMKERIKVAFIIPTLHAGGAERVMSYVSQNLNSDEFNATLVVIGKKKDAVYPVEKIEVVFLEKEKVRYAFFSIIRYLRHHRPQAVISAIVHLNTIMAAVSIFFPKIKFVGRETFVRSATQSKKKKPLIEITKIQKYLLDAMICQSLDMKEDMINNFNFPPKKLTTIHNPVNDKFRLKSSRKPDGTTKFVTIGRLLPHKGYVRIMETLAEFDSPFSYTIIGEGRFADEIAVRAKELNIFEKIHFVGFTDEVEYFLQEHDIYLHGSFVEGFPNVMLESCAVGTPVIAFDAPGGINEIVEPGINGFIASDKKEFLTHIHEVVKRDYMSPEQIRASVVKKYSSEKIINEYEIFIKKLLDK